MALPVKKVPIHLQSAQSRVHIKGGRIVNDDQSFDGDIYIEDGIIKQIGLNLVVPGGAKVIEARGKLILPGGIDTSTHLYQSVSGIASAEGFYGGTKAALTGGTTTIFDNVIPAKNQSLVDAYAKWREQADSVVCCDYGVHVWVTSWSNKVSQDMETLVKEKGVSTFHVDMAHKDLYMLSDDDLYSVFKRCRELGALALVHAENGNIIASKEKEVFNQGITGPEGFELSHPEEGEAEAVYRATVLSNQAGCPLLVTKVTSRTAADVLSGLRRKGKVVFGESLAASLGTDGSHYYDRCWRHAAGHVVSPPLRNDTLASSYLMDLLANNDLQVSGSSHCALSAEQKALGKDDFRKIPEGVNGVADRMSVLWEKGVVTGKMDPCRFVAVTSTNAARMFNVYPKKGKIAVGSDADVVVWDASATHTITAKSQQSDFNIFEGLTCRGVALYVLMSGSIVVEPDGLHITQGLGRFVSVAPNSEYVYAKLTTREKFGSAVKKVEREPYTGPASALSTSVVNSHSTADASAPVSRNPTNLGSATQPTAAAANSQPAQPTSAEFHTRTSNAQGVRHQQDSSFSLSGAQIDDSKPNRTTMKITQAPGGKSSQLW